jgi:hypothetical protein
MNYGNTVYEWTWSCSKDKNVKSLRTLHVADALPPKSVSTSVTASASSNISIDTNTHTPASHCNKRSINAPPRELISHRGTNPFLNQNSYVDDIGIRDQFMKPVNTSPEE